MAQRSSSAPKEIAGLIGETADKAAHGTELVGKSSETLRDICTSIDQVGVMMEKIRKPADEQFNSVGEINTVIGQLDQITQQNAVEVETCQMIAAACTKVPMV